MKDTVRDIGKKMPPKRKKPTKSEDDEVKAGSHVYVLTRKVYDHADRYNSAVELVGIYNSKDAAVASAGYVDTGYGTFDEAIDSEQFEDSHEDNRARDAAPDFGLLLKVGHEDEGEGDNVQLFIEKTFILGMPEPSKKKSQPSKKKKAMDNTTASDYGHGNFCSW